MEGSELDTNIETTDFTTVRLGRRRFLQRAGVLGAAIPVASGLLVAACYDDPTGGPTTAPRGLPPQTTQPAPGSEGGTAVSIADTHTKIDSDHKKGIEDFLKNQTTPLTKGKGNQPLAPRPSPGEWRQGLRYHLRRGFVGSLARRNRGGTRLQRRHPGADPSRH